MVNDFICCILITKTNAKYYQRTILSAIRLVDFWYEGLMHENNHHVPCILNVYNSTFSRGIRTQWMVVPQYTENVFPAVSYKRRE